MDMDMTSILGPYLASGKRRISVTGSGGKTSFIRLAATSYCDRMLVGIGTTTKMYRPDKTWPLDKIRLFYDKCLEGGKISGLSGENMYRALSCGLLLIEADGSSGRPLKGWNDDEPVVPDVTEVTVGVFPVHLVGHVLRDQDIFRPEKFRDITGLCAGDVLTARACADIIESPAGLFKGARGDICLFLSHCEDEKTDASFQEISAILKADNKIRNLRVTGGCLL